jgi:hypothetical protein
VEHLEKEILTDFLEPIGAMGFMMDDSGSKTDILKLTNGYTQYSSRPGQAHVDRCATF